MSEPWPVLTESNLERRGILLVQDGNHGEQRPRRDEFEAAGMPFIRAADLAGGRVNLTGAETINHVAVERIRKGFGKPCDVLLSHKGTVGRVAMAPADAPPFVCSPQTTFWRTLDESKLNSRFLFVQLRSPFFQTQLDSLMNASDMAAYVSLTVQRTLKLLVPPIDVQRRIAGVVGALDEKIAHNDAASERLRLLLNAECAALVREGTSEAPLSEVARFVNGRAFTKDANGRGRPILRIKELNGGVTEGTLWSDVAAEEDNIARHHDLLFAWSGSLDIYRWSGREATINQHIFKVIPDCGYPGWLVEYWLGLHLPEFRVIASDKAVTMGHIRRSDLDEALVPLPPVEQLRDQLTRLNRLDALRSSFTQESQALIKLREQLIPGLMSQKLDIASTYDPTGVLGAVDGDSTEEAA
jgi:type I restriction enzyme, S subunit